MSYDGVIDPASDAALASIALEEALSALAQAVVQARAAASSASSAEAAQAAIADLVAKVMVPYRWTDTVLQLKLGDGYGPGVDLEGPEGPTGPVPAIAIGKVSEGDFAVARQPGSPDEAPVLDFTLARGNAGWTPVPAFVVDGSRIVLRIVDWTGGQGPKPAAGLYVGATGFVPAIANAVDLRGPVSGVAITGTPTAGQLTVFDGPTSVRAGGVLSAFGQSLIAAATASAVKQLLAVASGDITDATAVGRAVLTATTTATALSAIGAQAALGFTPENAANKAQANGYAGLDSTGKVPTAQLPASVLGDVRYAGAWNAATNSPAIPAASSANMGLYYVVQTAGTTSISGQADWQVGDWLVSNGTGWDKIDNTDAVKSVAGLVGAVTAVALKTQLVIASTDITDVTATGRSVLTAGTAAALTALLTALVGDTGTGGTKGLVPAPAAGDAAAGKFLRADATWAAPASSFPLSGISAKTAAYPIVAADKGVMFDLTGSFNMNLPAVSGASPSAPLYYHWRKRDGSGVCTVTCAGSDTFANGRTSVSLYQEHMTLVSFGGPWYSPPGGRQNYAEAGVYGFVNGAAGVQIGFCFGDGEARDVEIDFEALTGSTSTSLTIALLQAGLNATLEGQVIAGVSSTASASAISASSFGAGPNMSATASIGGKVLMRNVQSTVAKGITFDADFWGAGSRRASAGSVTTAGALSALSLTVSAGSISGIYRCKVARA